MGDETDTEIPFIDQEKAPEGATHAYINSEWKNGVPSYENSWEKVVGDRVYEYCQYEGWVYYTKITHRDWDAEHRVAIEDIPPNTDDVTINLQKGQTLNVKFAEGTGSLTITT